MSVIMKTTQLSRVFSQGEGAVQALDNVTLEIYAGDFTAIMGSSGSGKSTLLYALSGLDKPSDGEIWLGSQRVDTMTERALALLRRESFGFVFQAINLVQNLSVEENILVAGYLTKTPREQVRKRCQAILVSLGIAELAGRLPSQLSGGQQQRAAIARAIINQPAILFADEPTGALNNASGQAVLEQFSQINQGGQSIVMVTHDLKTAARANRILFMRDGRIDVDFRFPETLNDPVSQAAEREKTLFTWLSERGW